VSPYPDHPLIRVGVPKVVSGLAVFAFSATMHEIILSLPFKYVALHAFNGMVRCCQSVVDTHCLSMDIDCFPYESSSSYPSCALSLSSRIISIPSQVAQVPLIALTKYIDRRFDNAFVGNALFWCIFCVVGQPMGIMMYYYDLSKATHP
jgi:hypothetical protein